MYNTDISNTQRNLFAVIDRAYNTYQKPIENGVMSMGHINLNKQEVVLIIPTKNITNLILQRI